jgi:inner membrane protein
VVFSKRLNWHYSINSFYQNLSNFQLVVVPYLQTSMDSLTQITLGAAVGEVVLGKKAGNRAMVWGAVAGTLPDLDILANLVTDPVSALAYHRAFTHSLTFAALVPLALGMLVHRIYGGKKGLLPQNGFAAIAIASLVMLLILYVGSSSMPLEIYNVGAIALIISAVTLFFPLSVYLREKMRKTPSDNGNASWQAWAGLFFFSVITHPLLDACTTYGTQLFEPFSSLRIAWNVVSVADPLYTFPFLACLILASRRQRGSQIRSRLNWAGIIISSSYLLLCTAFYFHVNSRMEATLEKEEIVAERYVVGPTILNSILWQGTAETASSYYTGQYSLLDEEPFFKLKEVPKQKERLNGHLQDRDVALLRWFTNDYYNVEQEEDGKLRMNDLRYGQIEVPGRNRPSYIFYFVLEEQDGILRAVRIQQGPEDRSSSMSGLWDRMMGRI